MKLKNTTDWPDHFLRRMVAWCCRELDVPASYLRLATFTKYRGSFRGRAWHRSRRILIRIGADGHEQKTARFLLNGQPIVDGVFSKIKSANMPVRDAIKQLEKDGQLQTSIGLFTRHEESKWEAYYPRTCKYPGRVNAPTFQIADRTEALLHVTAHEVAHHARWQDTFRNREARVDGMTLPLLEKFRANRESLLAEWSVEPKQRSVIALTRQQKNDAKARKMLATWERKLKLAKTKVVAYRRKVRYYDRVAATRAK